MGIFTKISGYLLSFEKLHSKGTVMKTIKSRFEIITEYQLASDDVLFSQNTVAALRDCSIATIERDRWIGIGIPFIKLGRHVRYRKMDIQTWLKKHVPVQSTTQAQDNMNL